MGCGCCSNEGWDCAVWNMGYMCVWIGIGWANVVMIFDECGMVGYRDLWVGTCNTMGASEWGGRVVCWNEG